MTAENPVWESMRKAGTEPDLKMRSIQQNNEPESPQNTLFPTH